MGSEPCLMNVPPRSILVTGARRGIGAAIAIGLSEPGVRMIIHHHDSEREAKAVADRCRNAGASVAVCNADLAVVDDVRRLAGEAGNVDVLVNNAARPSNVPPAELELDEWTATLAVNVTAPLLLTQLVAVGMSERQWGRVINISSATVRLAGPSGPAYVASKAALVGLTRSLARYLGSSGITVNALSPGAILTENERELYPDEDAAALDAAVIARQAVPRRLAAADVVGAARFLASEEAGAVTGQVLEVGGGLVYR